jgi:energy-coupling factor transporter ATP-binding protein EcfA2
MYGKEEACPVNEYPPLIVENLQFRYRDREEPALQDIGLQLEAGEILLVAGPSGCGKTTLARCINGLIPRSYKGDLQGTIVISGQNMQELSLARISQSVGTVLQDPERQILGTKVLNEVAFGLENLGLEREQIIARSEKAMERLRISHLRNRETFSLSGGEKQKVALAGVLAMQPALLLLDEPLASLDPASAVDALQMVRALADEGMAILIVEHRVEDVLKINPDRVIFMQAGRIIYNGLPGGLTDAVDYHEVKLPAKSILRLARSEPAVKQPAPPGPGTDTSHKMLVRFEGVNFHYLPGQPVLQEINFNIRAGDVIAILGANGAGKTTLVKHAIGLLKPTSGEVWVGDRPTSGMSVAQIAKTLGYVFQSPSHMLFAPTVSEELAFGPGNLGHSPQDTEKEVEQAIDIMNLGGMEADPPLALSFGQQKRVSIAAVLAMRSRILVMDEPTAGQDYRNYTDFMDSILSLPGFDAILFITHDVDLAVVYANRVIMVGDGKVIADGEPHEVLGDYGRLKDCRLVPTSLLDLNLEMYDRTGRFMRAEALAHVGV